MVRWQRERLGTCDFEEGESYSGACDSQICNGAAYFDCASEDCANLICERHRETCPACGLTFCSSQDQRLHDCFYLHETSGQCKNSLIVPLLTQLEEKLAMPSQATLREFIKSNGDGLGNPLPREVPADFALAALCLCGRVQDVPPSARIEQKATQLQRRAARQREARACRRLGLGVTATRAPYHRVDLYKRSTVLIASGALVTRIFSGSPHYSQQIELLRLLGVHKQEDYVRDRLNALVNARPQLYNVLLNRAESIAQRESNKATRQRALFS